MVYQSPKLGLLSRTSSSVTTGYGFSDLRGADWIRTSVRGFADPCLTTRPQRHKNWKVVISRFISALLRESNPRTAFMISGFQVRCNRPLYHLSMILEIHKDLIFIVNSRSTYNYFLTFLGDKTGYDPRNLLAHNQALYSI